MNGWTISRLECHCRYPPLWCIRTPLLIQTWLFEKAKVSDNRTAPSTSKTLKHHWTLQAVQRIPHHTCHLLSFLNFMVMFIVNYNKLHPINHETSEVQQRLISFNRQTYTFLLHHLHISARIQCLVALFPAEAKKSLRPLFSVVEIRVFSCHNLCMEQWRSVAVPTFSSQAETPTLALPVRMTNESAV